MCARARVFPLRFGLSWVGSGLVTTADAHSFCPPLQLAKIRTLTARTGLGTESAAGTPPTCTASANAPATNAVEGDQEEEEEVGPP